MKGLSAFVVFPLILNFSSAWRLPSLVQKAIGERGPRRFAVPKFLLDTHHPWLEANIDWLTQYPDLPNAICSKSSPLWTAPQTRLQVVPETLFHNLSIEHRSFVAGPQEWDHVTRRLWEIRTCDAALDGARYLHVNIGVQDGPYVQGEPVLPPEIPKLFADVLSRMPALSRLDWGVSSNATRALEREFSEQNLTLPSVTQLQPGAWSGYMAARCPNLHTLYGGGMDDHWSWNAHIPARHGSPLLELVRATKGLPVKRLALNTGWAGWSPELLDEIWRSTPNITTLMMHGSLYGEDRYRGPYSTKESRKDGAALKECLLRISRFVQLQELALPYERQLDLGFDGGAWCGNAYFGEDGREYGRLVVREGVEAVELAASIVMSRLPNVKNFSIGSFPANYTDNGRGQTVLSWPWTGRLEEYALEAYPL